MAELHKNLARGGWPKLSLSAQLGNIGSEYERAVHWKAKGKPDLAAGAFERALELFDLTLADARWKNYRLREISRAREALCAEITGSPSAQTGGLSKFFYYLAVAARRESGLA